MLGELREQLRSGSAEDYLCKLFEKIERSKLNGFTTLAKESALQQARDFDRDRSSG